ncbi:MAG: hypothetical protein BWY91_02799 [bacterium ADurb.BinA028]|nr:MAG: hypothetical protein BWY91_02799 [bacterium ADurb.BinA028]
MSIPGIHEVASRATLDTLDRSDSSAFPAPGY